MSYFFGDGPDYDSYIVNKNLPKYFYCRYNSFVFDDYIKCTNYRTWDYTDYINYIVEAFSGKWYEKFKHNDGIFNVSSEE